MTKQELALEVIERLKKEYPDADCTLDYDEAWKLLVSVRLAAQCTDARVNVVVEDLYAKYPDVDALADSVDGELVMQDAVEISKVKNASSKEKKKETITVLEGEHLYNILDLNNKVTDLVPGTVGLSRKLARFYSFRNGTFAVSDGNNHRGFPGEILLPEVYTLKFGS